MTPVSGASFYTVCVIVCNCMFGGDKLSIANNFMQNVSTLNVREPLIIYEVVIISLSAALF